MWNVRSQPTLRNERVRRQIILISTVDCELERKETGSVEKYEEASIPTPWSDKTSYSPPMLNLRTKETKKKNGEGFRCENVKMEWEDDVPPAARVLE